MADKDQDRLSKTISESAHADSGLSRDDVTAGGLIRAIIDFVKESLTLLALEGRLAILSLIVMLAAGIFAAVLLVSVWLLLLAALAVVLVRSGWPWEVVLLSIAAANAILAFICGLTIRWLSRNLLFTATLRNLRIKNAESPDHA
jgi:hypothetical protein